MAGLWLRACFDDVKATKVKAHLTKAHAESLGKSDHHRGNEVVDLLAKEAASIASLLAKAADKQAAFSKGWRQHYIKVAKLLGLWKGKQAITKSTRLGRRQWLGSPTA